MKVQPKSRRSIPPKAAPAPLVPPSVPSASNGAAHDVLDGGPEALIGISELAAWTGLPLSWLYAQTAAGTIPCLKLGQYVRFRRSEIAVWLESKRRKARIP
jgi:excisionase family DNA binding protein